MVSYPDRVLHGEALSIDVTGIVRRFREDLPRRVYRLYPTRIEDRFGNYVTYSYASIASQGLKLTQISGNDGRMVSFTYNLNGQIASATAGAQTVSYGYTAGLLSSTTLPDGSNWGFSTSALVDLSRYVLLSDADPFDQPHDCQLMRRLSGGLADVVMTHPSGAKGVFRLGYNRLYRTNVAGATGSCNSAMATEDGPATWRDYQPHEPLRYDVLAVQSKTISGPGIAAQTWQLQHHEDFQLAGLASEPVNGTRTMTTMRPDGSREVSVFGTDALANEGQLLSREVRASNDEVLSRRTNTYVQTSEVASQPFPNWMGQPLQYGSIRGREDYNRPLKQSMLQQQGVSFTFAVNAFDALARPTQVTRSSTLGYSRTEATTYADNTVKWVLGLVAQVKCTASIPSGAVCNGGTNSVVSETTYDPTYSLPLTAKAFGLLQKTWTYDTSSTASSGQLGTMKSVKDGNGHVTTLTDWTRGIPKSIAYADGSSVSASVNDNGWIAAVTDENGFTTGYGHDPMGRLTSVVYPSGEGWANSTSTFQQVWSSEYGIDAGHWKRTSSTGNGVNVRYYDAMWRPVVEESYDAGARGTTRSVSVKRYDPNGQLAFQSYPIGDLTDYSAVSQGIRTTYDPLGRVAKTEQDSELGPLPTATEYLSGLQTKVTNPRGHVTITAYQAYDEPSLDMPVVISHPEGSYTDIYRDALGKTTALRRRNADASQSVWRRYVYDGNQQLCKTIEPETGATVIDYDGAGNLAWSAAGLTLPDTANCNRTEAYSSGRRVDRSYDARNRIATLLFPDGRGNQSWSYEKDGAVASISTNNSNGGEQVINRYTYNKRRLLTGESVEQPGWYTWSGGYGYNANGHLTVQTFPPTGLTVDYAPNALGQATRAGTYATGVSYYPNGAVKQFTYGNGIVHTLTQNARQLPLWSTDTGVINYETTFDANGNTTAILDHARGSTYSRWMSYDGLDRLTDAGSASFGGDHWHRFTYDTLDNLKTWKLAGVKDHNYYYDPNENRLTNINTSTGAGIVGLGYDVQGNLQQRNGQGYQFDYGNRLREVTGKEYYRYDGHGRRVLAWTPTTGSILSQYSQTGQLVFQQDQRQSKNIDHIYLAGSLVATREYNWGTGATSVRYQHADALGSPVAVTNESGQVVDRTQFEPFGAAINKTIQGVGYTGHVMDAVTGLTYMQQRYYDPAIGRILSVDPVTAYSSGDMRQFNRYAYAYNNPYKFTDPDGRQSIAACAMNPANAAVCAEAGIATGSGSAGAAGGSSGGGGIIAGILTALGLEGLIQRADTADSAADKIKEGTSPSTGPKSGNGDVHPGGEEAADAAWDSIEGVGETKRYEHRHGNVTEVKQLEGGGVADKHTSTKSDHKGAPTIKIRDAEKQVIQTTRYEKKP